MAILSIGRAYSQTNQTVVAGGQTITVNFPTGGCDYQWTNDNPAIGLAASGGGDIPSFTATNTSSTPIVAHITAIPKAPQFAYIANDQSSNVSVINTVTNNVIATIFTGVQPHGVAVSKDGTKVYINSHNDVLVIDVATNKVVKSFVGLNSFNDLTISPDGSTLYVPDTRDGFYIVDLNTGATLGKVTVQNQCTDVVVTPDGKTIYATGFGTTLSVVDVASMQIIASLPMNNLSTEVVMSPDGKFVYLAASADNQVDVISTATNTIVKRFTANNYPGEMALSSDGSLLYVSNGYGKTISVMNTATGITINSFACASYPGGISLTQDERYLYVNIDEKNEVQVFDTQNGNVVATIPVGNSPSPSGDFITPPTQSCTGSPITFTITVNPAGSGSTVNASGNLTPLSTVYGTYSTSERFTIVEQGLTAGVLITAPEGFEVSTDNSNFHPSVSAGVGGNALNETIFIRLKSTATVGTHSGNIVISNPTQPDFNLPMPIGTVTPVTLTVTADNQKRGYGQANPPLTLSYNGFVNGEDPSVLTVPPTAVTTAGAASPKGKYPITVSGGLAANYVFNYADGTLTITAPPGTPVSIPNAFTPNSDGINDTWNIANMDIYPKSHVQIFNRYGTLLFNSVGYTIPWDGTAKSTPVPDGVYYYIITVQPGADPVAGSVTVIR